MVHPHDRLIRYILGRREYAVAFARLVLPPAITAAIDLDGLRPAPGRQLDPELRERIVDLLFHLPLRGGGEAWLDLIIEHQSTSDRWMALRTAAATTQRWSGWQRENPKARALPMVFTVVVSHDPRGWRSATDIGALLDLTDAQRAAFAGYLPSLPFHLFDLSRVNDGALRLGAEAAAVELMLLCFRHARDEAALALMLRERAALLRDVAWASDGIEAVMALVRYLVQVIRRDETATVIMASIVEAGRPELMERIEMENFEEFVERFGRNWRAAFAERLRAEGVERGIEQGIEQGITRGKRETLASQLRLKFNLDPLPDWLARRLDAAGLDALIAAERRILFVDRPEDVLPEPEPPRH
ncbi:MAG: Rpn family recombination-promoting nuclease/putative transposase [Myxococcales bacterium]|nr:Rpn family recombination-promoting nuclease/putative transposase [Myxococcales bacterium]